MVSRWTVFFCLLLGGSWADNPSPPMAWTKGGMLQGKYMTTRSGRSVEAFLGIPYGKPPLGELRFEPPQPADPWKGVRRADTMPPACMQFKMSVGNKSEDCLFLNVFTPRSNNSSTLPVMVWIHGGSFMYNAISTFTPEYMCEEGNIVLVTIQYRLGYFGFLPTGDSTMPGNQALKDQRLGLRWVKDNIRQFGGDPSKVTLFGQSAGAMCIHALMLFASKEGLFRAAITHSGVSLSSVPFRLPAEVKYQVGQIANTSGCPSDSQGLVRCLKNKSAEDILNLVTPSQILTGQPTPGLVLEPECVTDRIISDNPWNRKVDLPWLTGVMGDEMLEFLAPFAADSSDKLLAALEAGFDANLPNTLNYQYSSANGSGLSAAVREYYFANFPISRLTFPQLVQALTDGLFIYPIREAVMRSNKSQTFMYKIDFIGANHAYEPVPPSERVGAAHEDDIYWIYPHPNSIYKGRVYSRKDKEFSKTFVKLWTNFATNLHPTKGLDMLEWKPFGSEEYYYHFQESAIADLKSKFLPERMEFWKNQPYINRDDILEPIQCDSGR